MNILDLNPKDFTSEITPVAQGLKRPRWSVMIPTFNPGKYFIEAINSAVSQNISPDEMQIEVVDDCSTKVDVQKIVNDNWNGRVLYHRLPKNVGHSFNFTESVKRAKGELVHLLHDDDKVKPGFYTKFDEIFKKYKNIGAAFCRQEYIDDDGKFMFYSEPETEKTGILENALVKLAEKQRIQYCAMVVKREAYEKTGGYINKNIGCEDWEMWVRIASLFPIAYEPEALAEYRIHRTSMTLTDMRTGQDMRFLREAADIFTQYLPEEKREEVTLFRRKHYAVYSFNNAKRMYEEFNDEEGAAAQLSETIILNSELVYSNLDFLNKFNTPIHSAGVSVIICCQNDLLTIDDTLKNLFNQKVPKYIPWEIILVDISTDNTSEIASEAWKKYGSDISFKILSPENKGILEARNTGIENSKYNFIVFCNPGNLLNADYVTKVSGLMMSNIKLGAIGGFTEASANIPFPNWFNDWSNTSYHTGDQFEYSGDITWSKGVLWSAGLAFRKEAWTSVLNRNFHSLFLDEAHKTALEGIDNELCYALRLNGWKISYSIELKLKIFIPETNLRWKYLRKLWKQAGANSIILQPYEDTVIKQIDDYAKIQRKKNYRQEIYKVYRKLRSYKNWELLSYSETLEDSSNILMIEFQLGKLKQLLKNIKTYNKKIRILRRIARKKDFKILKYSFEKIYFSFPQYRINNDKRGISVILNVQNHSDVLLLRALEKLKHQQLPAGFRWEVILISSFIKNDTKKLISVNWQGVNAIPLRIIQKHLLSNDSLRSISLTIAKYNYLIFLRENTFVYPDYVRIAYKIIHKNNNIGMAGGEVEPDYDVKPPKWFGTNKEYFNIGRQAENSGDITFTRGYLWEDGLVIKKKAMQSVYENENSSEIEDDGRTPTELNYEREFSDKIRLAGWKIFYESRLRLKHFLSVKQFSWEYMRSLRKISGREDVKNEAMSAIFSNIENSGNANRNLSWLYNANNTLRQIKNFQAKKIFSGKKDLSGDNDVLEIEELRGKFSELITSRKKYYSYSKEVIKKINGNFHDLRLSNGTDKVSGDQPGVSVIICCYNSAKVLGTTLKYIFSQKVPEHTPWEVVVVDNASTDNTSQIARDTRNNSNSLVPFKIVKEMTPGLSAARQKGFNTAKYEYIVFCDDDNLLTKDFVSMVYEIMKSNNEIGVLGGQSKAEFDVSPPSWFKDWKNSFAIGKQSDVVGDITWSRGYVWGASMVVRKKAWKNLLGKGFKSLLTDRKGNTLSAGGDTEICYALRNEGWKIWYDPRLKFKHHLPTERLEWQYLKKLFKGFGQASVGLDYYLKKTNGALRKGNKKSASKSVRQEIHKTLSVLRKTRYKKLLSYTKNREGDSDIPMIEYCLGRLEELLKTRITYNRGIKLLKRTARKNDLKHLESVFKNYHGKFPQYKIIKKLNGVSVIVCTYNGAERLPETIRHLALQKANPNLLWEIILVDNASTDNSKETALNEWTKYDCKAKLKIVDQPVPGKQLALEKGYEHAKYEYLITCDDDNWLDENFVELVYEIMSSNEKIGALGGPNEALCEVQPPEWFKYFQKDYAAGSQGDIHTGKVTTGNITWKRGFVWGAGMIVRRTAWKKLIDEGFKTSMSCRKGTELTSGGDSEACFALVLAGWEIWYDTRLKLKHCMPAGRLTWDYLRRLFVGFGVASVGLEIYEKAIKLGNSDIAEEKVNEQDWWYEVRRTIGELRKYGLGKILSLRFPQENNTGILMLEFYISRLRELLKVKNEYNKKLEQLKTAPWKKNYPELKANHRKFLESENDYRYGWPWKDEPVLIPELKKYPRISILSPSFNSAGTIEKAILSVMRQGYPDFEHIICDAGSTDGTVEILKKYKHVKWISEPDKGQSDAMNKAFKMASGDLVAYLNSDDYFQRGIFFKVAKAFEENPAADMVVGNLFFEYAGHTFTREPEIDYKKIMLPFLYMFPINPVSYFYKKNVQTEIGEFPLENHLTMDYWFLLKAYQNYNLIKIEDYMGTFCMNGYNKTSNANNRKNTHVRVLYHCWNYDKKNLPFYLYKYYKFFYYEKKPYNLRNITNKFNKNLHRAISLLTLKKNKYYSEKLYEIGRDKYYENRKIRSISAIAASFIIYPKSVKSVSRWNVLIPATLGKNLNEKIAQAFRFIAYPPGMKLSHKLNYYGNEYRQNNKSLKGNLILLGLYAISPSYIFKREKIKKSKRISATNNLKLLKKSRLRNSDTLNYLHSVRKSVSINIRERVKSYYNFFVYPKGMSLSQKLNYHGRNFKTNNNFLKGNLILFFAYPLSPKVYIENKRRNISNMDKLRKQRKISFALRLKYFYEQVKYGLKRIYYFFRYRRYKAHSKELYASAQLNYHKNRRLRTVALLIPSYILYPVSVFNRNKLSLLINSTVGNLLIEKLKGGSLNKKI